MSKAREAISAIETSAEGAFEKWASENNLPVDQYRKISKILFKAGYITRCREEFNEALKDV